VLVPSCKFWPGGDAEGPSGGLQVNQEPGGEADAGVDDQVVVGIDEVEIVRPGIGKLNLGTGYF
jgi:hypothetical protein